jgi:hypothetical protein
VTGSLARACYASPSSPAPRSGKAKAEQDEPEHNGYDRARTTGEPNGRQMHPASTDEQQSGRKRFQTHGQLGNGPLHHGRLRGRKASTTSPPSRSTTVNQLGRSGCRRSAPSKTHRGQIRFRRVDKHPPVCQNIRKPRKTDLTPALGFGSPRSQLTSCYPPQGVVLRLVLVPFFALSTRPEHSSAKPSLGPVMTLASTCRTMHYV